MRLILSTVSSRATFGKVLCQPFLTAGASTDSSADPPACPPFDLMIWSIIWSGQVKEKKYKDGLYPRPIGDLSPARIERFRLLIFMPFDLRTCEYDKRTWILVHHGNLCAIPVHVHTKYCYAAHSPENFENFCRFLNTVKQTSFRHILEIEKRSQIMPADVRNYGQVSSDAISDREMCVSTVTWIRISHFR